MLCPRCGVDNLEGGTRCFACGTALERPARGGPTWNWPITSFVLGVLGIPSCGLTGLPGIAAGIVGLRQLRRHGGAGEGWAYAGMALSGISLLAGPILFAALFLNVAHR